MMIKCIHRTFLLCAFILSCSSGQALAQVNCPADPFTWDDTSDTGVQADTDAIPFTQRNWICSLSEMTKQLSGASQSGTMSIGTLFDAQNHIQTQTVLQELQAEAHKDYRPSIQVCRISSIGNNLANNEAISDRTHLVLNGFLLDRDLGSSNAGDYSKTAQVKQFEKTYCNFYSNGAEGLLTMCDTAHRNDTSVEPNPVDPGRFNRDINYAALIDLDNSLNLNFEDATISDDETDVLAMARVLYLHNPFYRPTSKQLNDEEAPYVIANLRALQAKYNVAKNSFSKIVSMKAAGSDKSTEFVKNAVALLTDSDEYTDAYVGENISYDGQMEILTKKIYQDPSFYTNLIESPANVKRQKAAMAGIKLMQDRDFLEALLRREMLLSLILEVKLSEKEHAQNSQLLSEE